MSISMLVKYWIASTDNSEVSAGNGLFLCVLLGAIFIPALHFKKIMHLNGRKIDFFYGCFLNYLAFSAVVSALNLAIFLTFDRMIMTRTGVMNLVSIFGWVDHGGWYAFFQQFAFLLLIASVIHTLTLLQTSWIGWTVDVAIIAVISVFTPIAALRAHLVSFFYLIIYNAVSQISACIALSVVIYGASYFALRIQKSTN